MDKTTKRMIGQNLQKFREEKGYTQADIAFYLGKSNTAIASWEQGLSSPDIETAHRLMTYYKLTIERLFDGIDIDAASSGKTDGAQGEQQ